MSQLDDALAALATQAKANEDAEDSAVTIINGIAARVDAAVVAAQAAGASPAQLQAVTDLSTALKSHSDPLAASIVANTPAAPAA